MVTGHDIATKVVNKTINNIKKKFEKTSGSNSGFETINTGGLMEIKKGKYSDYYYPSLVNNLENWRDFIHQEYQSQECQEEEIKTIFKMLCKNLYTQILSREDMGLNDRKSWVKALNEMISDIEKKIEKKGLFRESLRGTNLLHDVEITVKPWISFSGIPDAYVKIENARGLFVYEGKTNSEGKIKLELMEGKTCAVVKTDEKEKKKEFKISEDKNLKIHPSIF